MKQAVKPAREEYDFAFRRYLEREHSLCISGNSTDYKPTYQDELDKLAADAIRHFERACRLLDKLTPEERQQCKAVYAHMHPKVSSYNHEDMVSFFLENQDPNWKSQYGDMKKFVDYVGPRWLEAYVTFCELRAMFQPDAKPLPKTTGCDPQKKAA